MTGVQRRKSGIYECRVAMPKALAKRPASGLVRQAYPDLVNDRTGQFKGEVARSLSTSDHAEARKRGRKVAVELHDRIAAALRLSERIGPEPVGTLWSPADIDVCAAKIHADWLR